MEKIYGKYRIFYESMKIGRVSLVCRSGAAIAGIIWAGGDSIVCGRAPQSVGKLTWIEKPWKAGCRMCRNVGAEAAWMGFKIIY